MATRMIAAHVAREKFADLTNRVKYTGEAIVITKDGKPFVAVVRAEDVEELERLRRWQRLARFESLAADAAQRDLNPDLSDDDQIAKDLRATRRELYRQRYGGT
jgi:prevent-host-death family protein